MDVISAFKTSMAGTYNTKTFNFREDTDLANLLDVWETVRYYVASKHV